MSNFPALFTTLQEVIIVDHVYAYIFQTRGLSATSNLERVPVESWWTRVLLKLEKLIPKTGLFNLI